MSPARVGSDVHAAAQRLRADGVVGYPTETLYGLGVSIASPKAIERLFELKGRPGSVPLLIAVPSVDAISQVAKVTPLAQSLFTLLPGPLTLILERDEDLPKSITAGGDSIGVRVPDHPVAQALLAKVSPITSTSANRHGEAPATTAEAAAGVFDDRVDYYLEGDSTPVGVASTIVDCRGTIPHILREGAVREDEIRRHTPG